MTFVGTDPERINARYRGIIDAAVDGIILIDAGGLMESFNTAAERIFGYRAQDVVGKNVAILMPEPDAGQHDAYIQRYLGGAPPRIIGAGGARTGVAADLRRRAHRYVYR